MLISAKKINLEADGNLINFASNQSSSTEKCPISDTSDQICRTEKDRLIY